MDGVRLDKNDDPAASRIAGAIFDLAPIGIEICDAQGGRLSANAKCHEIFGCAPSCLTGESLFDDPNLSPDNRSRLRQGHAINYEAQIDFDAAKTAGRAFSTRSGSIYLNITIKPVAEQPGQPVSHHIVLYHDITERKLVELALRDSEERFRKLFEEGCFGMVIVSRDARFARANPAFCSFVGYEEAELQKLTFGAITHPDHLAADMDNVRRVAAGELTTYKTEKRYIRKDGKVVWGAASISAVRAQQGAFLYFLVVVEDITEQKRAEAAARENEAIFSTFLEHSPVHVFFKDEQARSLRLSRNYESMLGMPLEQALGKSMDQLFPGELARGMVEDDMRILREGKRVHVVEELAGRTYETTKFPIFVDGKAVMLAGFTVDISERRQAEEEKAKLQEQLFQAQKMESVGRLAGGVAHDFNNMLGVMLGHLELAEDEIEPSSPVAANLKEIYKAAKRSADLTKQLLAFARKQTIAPKILDLNETVEGMLKMLRRMVGENIELTWTPGEDIATVRMDPTQIHQILANLCVNARDAIKDVGHIRIATTRVRIGEDPDSLHIASGLGELVLLTVTDDGAGMDQATLDKVFEPFFTTKELGRGTGLGLSTVHGIVKQNGGHISVHSEVGRGTTFRIYLPAHSRAMAATVSTSDIAPSLTGRETILLVEDEESLLQMSRRMLEGLGYLVLTARGPDQALRLAKKHGSAIHLLLTDVIMPDMNGRALADALRGSFPKLRCLFMSGYTADFVAHQGVLDEGISFLQKPFTRKELAEALRRLLDTDNP